MNPGKTGNNSLRWEGLERRESNAHHPVEGGQVRR
jgi:hypothetical protein